MIKKKFGYLCIVPCKLSNKWMMRKLQNRHCCVYFGNKTKIYRKLFDKTVKFSLSMQIACTLNIF